MSSGSRLLVIIAGTALGVWVMYELAAVILVLIFAVLFAYVVAPLVQLAERPIRISTRRWRLPRGVAIVLIYLLMAGILSIGGALLLPSASEQVDDMIASAPAYAQSVVAWERDWSGYYDRLRIPLELRRNIDQSVLAAGQAAVASSRASLFALAGALSNLPWLMLIPILAFFLLKDAVSFRRSFLTALPHRARLHGHRLLEDLNATLGAYIRAQLLACAVAGIVCGIGFAVLGVPYPLLLGALAGALEFIPLVGPLAAALIIVAVSAASGFAHVWWVVIWLGLYRLFQDYVLSPHLMSQGVELHPLMVIFGVFAGGEIGGIAGIFLSVAVLALMRLLYHRLRKSRKAKWSETLPSQVR